MTTALILRPADSPKLWVLEVDGPRRKYTQRGEGSYYLSTDNQPVIDPVANYMCHEFDPRLREDFGEPHWEIYQNNDGSVHVHACRPTDEEMIEGDLHGALGSIIKIAWPCRPILRNALRLARLLCKADPIRGLIVAERDLVGIVVIQSDIDVYMWREGATAPTRL
jgi:hypothetical protein